MKGKRARGAGSAGGIGAHLIRIGLVGALLVANAPSADAAMRDATVGAAIRDAAVDEYLIPRYVPVKPARYELPPGNPGRTLHLKFVEGSLVRLRSGALVSLGKDDLFDLYSTLEAFPRLRIERLFDRPEAVLLAEKARIEAKSGREQADKNLYYRVVLPRDADAVALIDALNALDIVEIAYAASIPLLPATPSFVDRQDYLLPAPDGIDTAAARKFDGGRGGRVRIFDIEYDWNLDHEDINEPGALIPNDTPDNPLGQQATDHGTAVIGQMIADDNEIGITGIAPSADLAVVNFWTTGGPDVADAIDIAHANASPGDVILTELEVPGAHGGCDSQSDQDGCVAAEYDQAYYDAIVSAVDDGIIVVEPAGNGGEDLDHPDYGATFPDDRPDSGAILVGAGSAPSCTEPLHARLPFSTFGSRVDLQGYGECIVTTGYGGLQGGDDDEFYTAGFGGTSGAAPMVAGATAVLSSIMQAHGDADGFSSREVRALLESTGTSQATGSGAPSGNIGPLPDLADALETLVPRAAAGGPYFTTEGVPVSLDATGSTDPQGEGLTYEWDLDGDREFDDATGPRPSFELVDRDDIYPVRVRVTGAQGFRDADGASVVVSNAPPSLFVESSDPPEEGGRFIVTGHLDDPGRDDPLSVTIDWGDGSGIQTPTPAFERFPDKMRLRFGDVHNYALEGTYTVHVCGSDDDVTICRDLEVQVVNSAPVVEFETTGAGTEGASLRVAGTVRDAGVNDPLSATIDWGDGSPTQPIEGVLEDVSPDASLEFAVNHIYANDGRYEVEVCGSDGQEQTCVSTEVRIHNVAPKITFSSDAPALEGTVVAIDGLVVDPGFADPLSATIDWGDGAPEPIHADVLPGPGNASLDLAARHTYGDNGIYEIELCARDDDVQSCESIHVRIDNFDPRVSSELSATEIDEGDEVFLLAQFDDFGWLDTYTSTVDWGTGLVDAMESGEIVVREEGPPLDRGTVEAGHRFGDDGAFVVAASVTDDDDGIGAEETTLTVNNVVPTALIDTSSATMVNGVATFLTHTGQPLELFARTTDPGSDDLHIVWDWADGFAENRSYLVTPPGADPDTSAQVSPRDVPERSLHAYLDACLYRLSFTSADDDGGHAEHEIPVVVTAHAVTRRAAGYWQHQMAQKNSVDFTLGRLRCYLAVAEQMSAVLGEKTDAATIAAALGVLRTRDSQGNPGQLFDRQALTAWLNFANGAVDFDEPVDVNGDLLPDATFGEVIARAEAVRMDPDSTTAEIIAQKDIIERINTRDG